MVQFLKKTKMDIMEKLCDDLRREVLSYVPTKTIKITDPLFVSYFLVSQISFVKPIPFISNQIQSFDYNLQNNVLTLEFSKEFLNLSVNVAISQIQ